MLLAAILFLGILTMWVPARWALTAFQLAIFATAAAHIVRSKRLTLHPTMLLLGAAVAWGLIQAFAGWSADRFKTLNEVRERTEAWLTDYNEQLPHDALGDLTPVEYRVLHHPETSRNGWH